MINLRELEALARAATPGPWFATDWAADDGSNPTTVEARSKEVLQPGQSSIWPDGVRALRIAECDEGEQPIADAAFIAATNPATVLELIALASAPAAPPVTAKHIEEIKDVLLWPVTEDDARVARDMLQSLHFDLSMQDGGEQQHAQADPIGDHNAEAAQQKLVEHAQAAQPKCFTCSGHGLIGGLMSGDGGYHSEDCPDCEGRGFVYGEVEYHGDGLLQPPDPPSQSKCDVCDGIGKVDPADAIVPTPAKPVNAQAALSDERDLCQKCLGFGEVRGGICDCGDGLEPAASQIPVTAPVAAAAQGDDLGASIMHAIYRACQRGDSPERMQQAVMTCITLNK